MEMKSSETICIIGSGFMGTQIGLHCAVKGYNIWLIDISELELNKALERQSQELKTGARPRIC